MATKTQTAEIDVMAMTVWEKLLAVRAEFYLAGAKKTGKNLHAEFMYFELEDIVPIAAPIFTRYGLLVQMKFTPELACATVININDVTQRIEFTIPMVLIAEPAKFRMNEVQGVGAAVTYYRRYLYMLVLDLVEADGIDKNSGEQEKPAPKKPATREERKTITKKLTSEDGPADAGDIDKLKGLLKELMTLDPDQEEFVQDVALKTEGFTTLTKTQTDNLIATITNILSEYSVEEK